MGFALPKGGKMHKTKTFMISDREIDTIPNLQVSFHLSRSIVVIEQIELYCDFSGFFQVVDLSKYSPSAKTRLEQICADYYNNVIVPELCFKEFDNDDNEPSPAA